MISTQSDWLGLGQTDVASNALGQIATTDRDGNDLVVTAVDPMNRPTQYQHVPEVSDHLADAQNETAGR